MVPNACPPIKALGIQILLPTIQGTIFPDIFLNFMSLLALLTGGFSLQCLLLWSAQRMDQNLYLYTPDQSGSFALKHTHYFLSFKSRNLLF